MTAPRSVLERPRGPPIADLLRGRAARAGFLRHWIGGGAKGLADLGVHAALSVLPIDACSDFGARSARVRGPTVYREAHERSLAGFRRLKAGMSEAEIAEVAMRRWENVGRLMAEYAVLHRLLKAGRITVTGVEHLRAALAGGRGAAALGVHLGNWEAAAPALAAEGFRLAAFYEPPPSWSRDFLSRRIRRRLGVRLLPLGLQGFKPALEALRRGEVVGVFGDECRQGEVQAPLFGRPPHPACNLAQAARLAREAGTAIVPIHVLRIGGRCAFQVVVSPAIELRPGASLREDVARLNAAIEPVILEHLDQWYYLHERLAAG